MNQISEILIYLGVISAMSERIMEMLKTLTDMANRINSDRLKSLVIHSVTFTASVIAAVIYPPVDVAVLGKIQYHLSLLVVGLLGSSGSGVWHDLLGTVTALKEQSKAAAANAKMPQQ